MILANASSSQACSSHIELVLWWIWCSCDLREYCHRGILIPWNISCNNMIEFASSVEKLSLSAYNRISSTSCVFIIYCHGLIDSYLLLLLWEIRICFFELLGLSRIYRCGQHFTVLLCILSWGTSQGSIECVDPIFPLMVPWFYLLIRTIRIHCDKRELIFIRVSWFGSKYCRLYALVL